MQRAHGGVDNGRGDFIDIELLGVVEPNFAQAGEGGYQINAGQIHIQAFGQRLLLDAQQQSGVYLLVPHALVARHHIDNGLVLLGVLAFEMQNVNKLAVDFVVLHALI